MLKMDVDEIITVNDLESFLVNLRNNYKKQLQFCKDRNEDYTEQIEKIKEIENHYNKLQDIVNAYKMLNHKNT